MIEEEPNKSGEPSILPATFAFALLATTQSLGPYIGTRQRSRGRLLLRPKASFGLAIYLTEHNINIAAFWKSGLVAAR